MKLGAERKKLIILGALVVVAVAAYFYNSGGEVGSQSTPGSVPVAATANPGTSSPVHPRQRHRVQHTSEHNTLRMEEMTVEAARGDIDPTLRLDLLQRLKTVKFAAGNRNLFAAGAVITPQMAAAKPVKIMPGPLPRPGVNPITGQPIGAAGALSNPAEVLRIRRARKRQRIAPWFLSRRR